MFGFRLKEPAKGDRITADWARELVRAVRSLRLQQGPGIRLSRTSEGTTVSVVADVVRAVAPTKHTGDDGDTEPIAVVLGGDDEEANQDTWHVGAIDEATEKPTYPVFNPTRLYWERYTHTLWSFRRICTHDIFGALIDVGPEIRTAVFTTVPENF